YNVEEADLLNPAVHIVIDENGRDNLPHPPARQSRETHYLIRKFLATGGSLRFEDRRQQIDAILPRWHLSIEGDPITKDHQIKLETDGAGRLSFQQRSLPIRELSADVLLQKNSADIRAMKFILPDSTIAAAGKLDNLQDPRVDLKAEADLALESVA